MALNLKISPEPHSTIINKSKQMDKRVIWASIAIVSLVAMGTVGSFILQADRQSVAAEEKAPTLIGTPLPPFSLKAVDGVAEDIAQWHGKVQIINFWATWCPPCKREIPALIALQEQYLNQGVQVVGIALDDVELVKAYVDESGINYPILVGEGDVIDVAEQLGNTMGILPYTVIVDRSGNISYVRYGEVSKKTIESEILALL